MKKKTIKTHNPNALEHAKFRKRLYQNIQIEYGVDVTI